MACFIVPVSEAIVTTIAEKIVKKHEDRTDIKESDVKIPFSKKLKVLNGMLWGGSGLLAFEHVWHGEVTPWFPFLTNASNPVDLAEMLHEMATVGTTMALLVTAVWGVSMFAIEKIRSRETDGANEEEKAV
ncbi:MAG: hypothetical protein ACI4Q5_02780 [Porcipelethomonas sp.]